MTHTRRGMARTSPSSALRQLISASTVSRISRPNMNRYRRAMACIMPGGKVVCRPAYGSDVTADLDAAEMLALYDAQLRLWQPDPAPAGMLVERDGPVLRISEPGQRGFV